MMVNAIIPSKIVNSGERECRFFFIYRVQNCKSFLPSLNAQISRLKRVTGDLLFTLHQASCG